MVNQDNNEPNFEIGQAILYGVTGASAALCVYLGQLFMKHKSYTESLKNEIKKLDKYQSEMFYRAVIPCTDITTCLEYATKIIAQKNNLSKIVLMYYFIVFESLLDFFIENEFKDNPETDIVKKDKNLAAKIETLRKFKFHDDDILSIKDNKEIDIIAIRNNIVHGKISSNFDDYIFAFEKLKIIFCHYPKIVLQIMQEMENNFSLLQK